MNTSARKGAAHLVGIAVLLIVAGGPVALAEPPSPAAAPTPDLKPTLGIDVGDRDDPVAKMMQLSGGLRVMHVDADSVATKIVYPGTHRGISRGDFILRILVKGFDTDTDPTKGTIVTHEDFRRVCARARRLIWEQPGHKGTLLVDAFVQAGYNMEDWKQIRLEGPLDMSGEPEPPVPDAAPADSKRTPST